MLYVMLVAMVVVVVVAMVVLEHPCRGRCEGSVLRMRHRVCNRRDGRDDKGEGECGEEPRDETARWKQPDDPKRELCARDLLSVDLLELVLEARRQKGEQR